MSRKNPIKISKEARAEMISSIKNYFAKERDEELGDRSSGYHTEIIAVNVKHREVAVSDFRHDAFDVFGEVVGLEGDEVVFPHKIADHSVIEPFRSITYCRCHNGFT